MASLGHRRKFDLTFTSEQHGPGSQHCFTLFPGYWAESQVTAFSTKLILRVLGFKERAVRKVLSKEFSAARKEWGVEAVAVHQTLHHSAKVHDDIYRQGLRNTVNDMQAHLFHWG